MSHLCSVDLPWYCIEYGRRENAQRITENIHLKLQQNFSNPYKVSYQYFYTYVPGEGKKPRITVCYITTNNQLYVGFSFCSLRSEPDKVVGKTIAFGRASKALVTGQAHFPIKYGCNFDHGVDLLLSQSDFNVDFDPQYKAMVLGEMEEDWRYPRVDRS
jgi:hypothetical protein